MNTEGEKTIGKCYGSVTVATRGQVVIPAKARKELGIEANTKMLVFECLQGRGLIMMTWDTVGQMLNFTKEQGTPAVSCEEDLEHTT